MIYHLVEKTHGPWRGRVWRSEEMSPEEASRRNDRITVMQWEPQQDAKGVSSELPKVSNARKNNQRPAVN